MVRVAFGRFVRNKIPGASVNEVVEFVKLILSDWKFSEISDFSEVLEVIEKLDILELVEFLIDFETLRTRRGHISLVRLSKALEDLGKRRIGLSIQEEKISDHLAAELSLFIDDQSVLDMLAPRFGRSEISSYPLTAIHALYCKYPQMIDDLEIAVVANLEKLSFARIKILQQAMTTSGRPPKHLASLEAVKRRVTGELCDLYR